MNSQKRSFTHKFPPEASKSFQLQLELKIQQKMEFMHVAFWFIHLSLAKICVAYLAKIESSQWIYVEAYQNYVRSSERHGTVR